MAGIIELRNVSFSAQAGKIIRNISYEFEAGKTTAMVGPSGGGKSTVLKLAAGLLVPDQGEILFKGKSIAQMTRAENLEFRCTGGVVFQDSALWANQSLYQILELPLRIHFPDMDKKQRERRIESAAAEAGYRKDLSIRPSRLSMGEQKLIAFARALICEPSLLYLDEWTESLDESAARRLIELVRQKKREGASIIMVSHDVRIVKDLADLVVMVLNGEIYLKITKEQIAEDEDIRRYVEMGMAS